MSSEKPNASNAGRQANLSMGGGPHMRMRVSAPGPGRCSDTIGRSRTKVRGGTGRDETILILACCYCKAVVAVARGVGADCIIHVLGPLSLLFLPCKASSFNFLVQTSAKQGLTGPRQSRLTQGRQGGNY